MITALPQACGTPDSFSCDQGHAWCIGRGARITSSLRRNEATAVRDITSLCELTGGRCTCSVMLITRLTFKVGQINRFYHIGKTDSRSLLEPEWEGLYPQTSNDNGAQHPSCTEKSLMTVSLVTFAEAEVGQYWYKDKSTRGRNCFGTCQPSRLWRVAKTPGSGRNEVRHGGYWANYHTTHAKPVRSAAIAGGLCGLFESSPRVVLLSRKRSPGRP